MSQAWTQMCHMCNHLRGRWGWGGTKTVTYPLNLSGDRRLRRKLQGREEQNIIPVENKQKDGNGGCFCIHLLAGGGGRRALLVSPSSASVLSRLHAL